MNYEVHFGTTADTTGAERVEQATKRVTDATQQAGTATSDAERGLESAANGALSVASKVGAAVAALAALKSVVSDSLAAFAESEISMIRLSNALGRTGQQTDKAEDGIADLATRLQGLTNISDETWTESAARLVEFGAKVSELPELLSNVEGVAGRMGGNIQGATDLVARAVAGNTRALAQFGIHLEETATKTEIMAAVAQIAASGQGKLRAEADGLAGAYTRLKMAGGDILENIGAIINSGDWLTKTLNGLATVTQDIARGDWLAVERNSHRLENLGNSALGAAPQVENVASATGRVSKASVHAGEDLDAFKKRLDGISDAAKNARERLERLTDAQMDAKMSQIDARQAEEGASPFAGDIQKARLRAEQERAKIGAERGDAEAEKKTARKKLSEIESEAGQLSDRQVFRPETMTAEDTERLDQLKKIQAEALATIKIAEEKLAELDARGQAVAAREQADISKATQAEKQRTEQGGEQVGRERLQREKEIKEAEERARREEMKKEVREAKEQLERAEQQSEEARRQLREEGFDEEGRRTSGGRRRSRPGAVQSPRNRRVDSKDPMQAGQSDLADRSIQAKEVLGTEDSAAAAATSAKGTLDKMEQMLSAQSAANNQTTATMQQFVALMQTYQAQLAQFQSQTSVARTQGTTGK